MCEFARCYEITGMERGKQVCQGRNSGRQEMTFTSCCVGPQGTGKSMISVPRPLLSGSSRGQPSMAQKQKAPGPNPAQVGLTTK